MSAVGNEYANALFLLAKERGELDEVAGALELCAQLFDENPAYVDLLATPSIPIEERIGTIGAVFHGRAPDSVSDFLSLLTERGYIRFFPDCAKEFERVYDLERHILRAEVISASPLSDDEKRALEARLEKNSGRSVRLGCVVDPSLVGGMKVRIGGRLYDGSLRTRITEILEEIKK